MELTRNWLDEIYARGRTTFTFEEIRRERSTTVSAMHSALARAQRNHLVHSPSRGLYVIVPPEYRTDGAPPWQWYLDPMLRHLGVRYYVGLLTAAAQHGASAQSAQEVQVVVDRQVHDRASGRQRLAFVRSARVGLAPATDVKTPTGRVRVSTPEMTMLDLVAFPAHAAGWGNIISVLPDLAPLATRRGWKEALRVDPPTVHVQRLGHLLDRVSAPHTDVLAEWLVGHRLVLSPLVPGGARSGPADSRWHIIGDPSVQPD